MHLCLSNSSCVSLQYLEIRQYSCGIAPNTEQIILRLNCTTYSYTVPYFQIWKVRLFSFQGSFLKTRHNFLMIPKRSFPTIRKAAVCAFIWHLPKECVNLTRRKYAEKNKARLIHLTWQVNYYIVLLLEPLYDSSRRSVSTWPGAFALTFLWVLSLTGFTRHLKKALLLQFSIIAVCAEKTRLVSCLGFQSNRNVCCLSLFVQGTNIVQSILWVPHKSHLAKSTDHLICC